MMLAESAPTAPCSTKMPGDPMSIAETWTGSVARSETSRKSPPKIVKSAAVGGMPSFPLSTRTAITLSAPAWSTPVASNLNRAKPPLWFRGGRRSHRRPP